MKREVCHCQEREREWLLLISAGWIRSFGIQDDFSFMKSNGMRISCTIRTAIASTRNAAALPLECDIDVGVVKKDWYLFHRQCNGGISTTERGEDMHSRHGREERRDRGGTLYQNASFGSNSVFGVFHEVGKEVVVVCSVTRSGVVWRSQFSICADGEKTGDGKEMP